MKTFLKRFLGVALVIIMVVAMLPVSVLAVDGEDTNTDTELDTAQAEDGDNVIDTEEELKAAIAAGGEVVLGGDITVTSTLTIAAGATVTLDLAGKTVSMTDSSSATSALIKNNGSLTIMDSVGGGKLTYNSTTPSTSYAYGTNTITNAGSLNVLSGIIENTTAGGSSCAIDTAWTNSGTTVGLNIAGGTITSARIGVRVCSYSGVTYNVDISGGKITGSYALQVYQPSDHVLDVNLHITGGTFVATSASYPYAIEAYNLRSLGDSVFDISGGTFDGYVYVNASTAFGDAKVDISGGTFNNDVYVYGKPSVENVAISGGTFNGYYGFYADSTSTISVISGGKFASEGNYASYYLVEGYVCPKVGEYYVVHQHDEDTVTDTATCEAAGVKTVSCSVCGFVHSTENTEAKGHKWNDGEVTTEPTCTEEGVKTFTCTVEGCGRTMTEAIAATGHDVEEQLFKGASCKEDGFRVYGCDCGDESVSYTVTIPATGHKWEEAAGDDPTCEEDGYTESYCLYECGETKRVTIPATGHMWDEGKVTTEPTCETKGVKTYTCTVEDCGKTKTEDIAATGHKWDEGKVTTEPTCTEAGVKTFTCANDKTHTKTEAVAAIGHKFVDGVCSVCKLSVVVDTEVPDTVTKEEVKVEEVKEVTVVESTETKEAEASVKTETATIVTDVVTDVTKVTELIEEDVVTEETAVNLVAVAAVVNGDEATVKQALDAGVITEEEVAAIEKAAAEGKPVITSTITVNEIAEEVVADTTASAIEKTVEKEVSKDAVVACYLDVSITLSAAGKEIGTLDKLEKPITITIAVPKEMQAEGRVYYVVRNHNGEVEVLDTTLNADGTISFTTDRFSTYALAYEEATTANTPATGDTSYIAACVLLMTVSVAGAVLVSCKKKAHR